MLRLDVTDVAAWVSP